MAKGIPVKLIFGHWVDTAGNRVTDREGIALSMGDLHTRSAFTGAIDLDADTIADLRAAAAKGYSPAFSIRENPVKFKRDVVCPDCGSDMDTMIYQKCKCGLHFEGIAEDWENGLLEILIPYGIIYGDGKEKGSKK